MKINNLAKKYLDDNARNYDLNRSKDSKWIEENYVIKNLLKKLISNKNKINIVDSPCGTGRIVDLIPLIPNCSNRCNYLPQ